MVNAYRADIDGLRSLAIGSILFFHLGVSVFGGGFVGVDIFFVISGFLITSGILNGMEQGTFSLLDFYKRRILRIFPALAVMLCGVVVAAFFLSLPNKLEAVGQSVIAATVFSSNIFFWRTSDYFSPGAHEYPLLHTWSLSLEEQFYVILPVLIMITYRKGRFFWKHLLLVSVLLSFLISIILTKSNPVPAFYLLPTRFWELGMGSMVAIGLFPKVGSAVSRGLLSFVGLGLIACGVFLLKATDPFPGFNALLPCLGTSLLIAYGQGTPVGRGLAMKPLVAIGLVSYSLYLWHWPIIVFYQATFGPLIDHADLAMATALSVVAAVASYFIVERPFRTASSRVWRPIPVIQFATFSIVALSTIGFLVKQAGAGMLGYSPAIQEVLSFGYGKRQSEQDYQFRTGTCFLTSTFDSFEYFDRKACSQKNNIKPNYLIIGDSHGAHLWRAFSEAYPDVHFLQATASGCKPTLDFQGLTRCTDLMKWAFGSLLPASQLDGVIFSARWEAGDLNSILNVVRYASRFSRDVIVLGPSVEYDAPLPELIAKSMIFSDSDFPERFRKRGIEAVSDRIEAELAAAPARFVSVYRIICPSGRECILRTPAGTPTLFDYGHFTMAGARYAVSQIQAALPIPPKK